MADGHVESGVYGLDSAWSLSGNAVDDRGRVLPGGLRLMWETMAPYFGNSRKRILFTNDVITGKAKPPVPRKQAKTVEMFSSALPGQMLRTLHNANVLARREPRLKRYTSGIANAPLERATRIEQWSDPMTKKLVSWDELTGMLQNEGEMGGVVTPSGADWMRTPPPFKPNPSDDDPDPMPYSDWWRDSEDQGPEAYVGRMQVLRDHRDHKKTRRAYEEAVREWELENPPLRARLIHATDCLPIGLRLEGDGPKIHGLLIRTRYSRNDMLRRNFAWGPGPGLEYQTSQGPRDVELIEGYLTDAHGMPYIVYAVDGMATRWADGGANDWAFVDLNEPRFGGMTRLLAHYEYGWHQVVPDPDMRGMPFGYAFAGADLTLRSLVGAVVANIWMRGHGVRGILPNENAPRDAYMDGSVPRKIKWEPGGDMPVLAGQVVDLLPQVLTPDLWRVADLLMGASASEGPPPGAYGGQGPESGRERTIIRRHIEDSQAHILNGGLRMWQNFAIDILELSAGLIRNKVVKEIRVPTTIPIVDIGVTNDRRGMIVGLNPDDCQRNYQLEAYFKPQPGENLALAEQAKGLVEAGLRPRRWFHEVIMGDDSPEQTEAEIVSDHMIYEEEGQADIRDLALRMRNDERETQRNALRQAGRVSPSGAPVALAGGLAGPPDLGAAGGAPALPAAAGPGPVGIAQPSSPAGMLGAAVAADTDTAAIRGDEIALQQGVPA